MLQGADWQVVEDGEGCEVREALSWKGWSPGLCTHSGLGCREGGIHSPRQLLSASELLKNQARGLE